MKKVFTLSILFLLSLVTTVSYASKKAGAPLKSTQADEFPVIFSSADESDEHWYYVHFLRPATTTRGDLIWSATEGSVVIHQLKLAATNQDLQRWKFIGDETSFTIVNQATGWTMLYSGPDEWDDTDGSRVHGRTYYLGEGTGINFAFETNVRGNWILRDLDVPSYANDRAAGLNGKPSNVCEYTVKDDVGNDIAFIPYEKTIVSGTTSVSLEVPNGSVGKGSLDVAGIDLTEPITASISGDNDGVFTLTSSTIPETGGTVEVIFSPTEVKNYTATLTLSSEGAAPFTIDLKGNGFAWSELPAISSADNSDEHWYYIKAFRKAAANTAFSLSDTTLMIVQDTLKTGIIRDDQQWKVCGTWEDGFYFINKASGKEMAYNLTATEDGSRLADRYYEVDGEGDTFDFVRFSDNGVPTADWQLRNRSFAERNLTATKIYLNESGGRYLCQYTLNDGGNRLSFVPADAPSISSVATVAFEVPKGDYAEYNLSIFGMNLTADITATISGNEDNVFSIVDDVTTLPADGGKLTIAFAPTADKKYTATLTLTSGATTWVVPITGNADLNMPTISTADVEEWYYIGFERKAGDNLVWTATPDEETGERYDTEIKQTALVEGNLDQQWKLVGTWVKGYQIINRNGGAFFFYYDPESGVGENTNNRGWLIEEVAFGDTVLFKRQSATAKWQFQVVGKNDGTDTHNYLNDYEGNAICVWTANDGGNPLNFTPIGGNSISTPAGDVDGAIVSVKYYNLMGREVLRPATTGIYIVRNTYASGKVKATKQLFVVK
jgi:hypothetical protein